MTVSADTAAADKRSFAADCGGDGQNYGALRRQHSCSGRSGHRLSGRENSFGGFINRYASPTGIHAIIILAKSHSEGENMKKNYVDYCLQQLCSLLAIPSPTGYTAKVSDYVTEELSALGCSPGRTEKGGVTVCLGGNDGGGLLLTAHLDTLGAMVSAVKENGRLQIVPLGGLDVHNTEGENVKIFTRGGNMHTGVFQLENASIHVNTDYKKTERTFRNMEVLIDEQTSSAEETAALGIRNGDIVCFEPRTVITPSGYIKSRFLDDKLSAAILLTYVKYLKKESLQPKRPLYLHFTVYEEIGHGGCASMPENVTEMLAVDMGCVGEGLQCDETMVSICTKDSQGPSSYELVSALAETARTHNIRYALDVYPSYGSDADAALKAGYDIRHCVIGPGVYASHGYERSHTEGMKNTFNLIAAYTV